MILGYLVLLGLASLVFLFLRERSLPLRFLVATSLFLLGAAALTYLFSVGDEPPADSTPVNQDILKREGLDPQEWEEYQQRLEGRPEHDSEG